MSAKVSVVVPVYNVEQYLSRCMESLISQTLKDILIICVDDGSTDKSLEILKKYKKKDKRITILSKKNGGLSSARNEGLKQCRTKYVMFCDSDDYFEPQMCEKMVKAIDESKSDLAACSMNVIYLTHNEMQESDQNYYRLKYTGKQFIDDELILKTDVSVVNKIFCMDKIRKYEIDFPDGLNNEDYYFYNAYMSVSKSIFFVNQRLYNYIRREDSIMSDNFEADKFSMDHLLVSEKIFRFYKKIGFLDEHTDLFWEQWVLGFWFAIEHSSKKYHRTIYDRAKKFLSLNYYNYLPKKKKIKSEVGSIMHRSIIRRLGRKARRYLAFAYKKINVKHRQRAYINGQLEQILDQYSRMSDRVTNLEGIMQEDED